MSEDKELKALMKKVHRAIARADDTGYEFSGLECGIISRIAHAKTIHDVPMEVEKAYKIIHERVMKRRVRP